MYQSPISIYETAMETIIEQRENAIFAKVQDAFDVQVDKAELIRALQYDRGQYEKGFRDGLESARTWIPVSERYPTAAEANADGLVLVVTEEGYVSTAYFEKVYKWGFVTHWMELPVNPKEGYLNG